jgi:hypothetical protein
MSWEQDALGQLDVSIDNYAVLATNMIDGYSWSQVAVGSKTPSQLFVSFSAKLRDDVVCVLQARGNDVREERRNSLPGLKVRVNWNDDGRPATRKKDEDNLDHFLCTREAVVMQLQTSFLTRGENFYVCNQELWCLQILEVTEEDPGCKVYQASNGKRYAAYSLWDSQAYTGADWLITNAQTGPKVIEAMIECGIEPPIVDFMPVTEWDRPEFPQAEGFIGGVVMWFNPNVGAKVLCEDGEQRFVPLKGIRDADGRNMMKRGEFCIVTPKQRVLLSIEMANTPGQFNAVRPADI